VEKRVVEARDAKAGEIVQKKYAMLLIFLSLSCE
jgi:hypothetical protein